MGFNSCRSSKLSIVDSDKGLSPGRHQVIILANAERLLIGHLETNFRQLLIAIYTFSFKKMHFKMLFGNGGRFVSASKW